MAYWVRKRVTGPLKKADGVTLVQFVIAERDDGGVFFQSFYTTEPGMPPDVVLACVQPLLDDYLKSPLDLKSIGTFDVEPNFYIPGMSPAKM